MIKIEYNDKMYNLPSSWDDVSLGNLMRLNNLQGREFSSHIEQSIYEIESVSDMPSDILMELPMSDLVTISNTFEWVKTLPNSIGTTSSILITIDDIQYVPVDLNVMSAGEFISLEVFNKGDVNNNLHLMASILVRPEVNGQIEKLKDMIDIQRRADLFKEKLMVGTYWPIVQSFFIGAATSSSTNMPGSLDLPKSLSKLRIVNS